MVCDQRRKDVAVQPEMFYSTLSTVQYEDVLFWNVLNADVIRITNMDTSKNISIGASESYNTLPLVAFDSEPK